MEHNYTLYRKRSIVAFHETLTEARSTAAISSVVKPGIVTVIDNETQQCILAYEEGREVPCPVLSS